MELDDDAAGRVAVFALEPPPSDLDVPTVRRWDSLRVAAHFLGAAADDPVGAGVLGILLVLLLVLGLEFTH